MIINRIKERMYRGQPVISFEFFPPKTEKGETALYAALESLVPLKPDFVSVTYGAGGTSRDRTRNIVCNIQSEFGLTAMAHLTCIGHTNEEITELLDEYDRKGVHDILALRGDPPRGDAEWNLVMNGPEYATDLVRMIREYERFCVGVAGFPETHPEAPSMQADLENLKRKVEAGVDFIVTQLFFENEHYFEYVTRARRMGITVPIIPGVMPITKGGQLDRFHELSGCVIPETLRKSIEACGEDEERIQETGLAYCAAQCTDLLARGAPGIHFYTLNQSRACHTVYAALHAIGNWAR